MPSEHHLANPRNSRNNGIGPERRVSYESRNYNSVKDVAGGGKNLGRIMDEVIEEALQAEEMGFDSMFFGEHHMDQEGQILPSPLMAAAVVAARTQRLKIGTAILVLPLYHPVHVAEDLATLDIISKGRAILGVGLGYQKADFDAYGLNLRDARGRLEESVEIIRECWTGKTFSYEGKHFQLNDVTCVPTPVQRPSPPLWFGGTAVPAVRRAGRMGDGWMANMFQDEEAARRLANEYRQAAGPGGGKVVLMRDAWIAQTKEEALRQYEPYWLPVIRYYWRAGLPELQHIRSESEITMESLAPPVMIIGDPEECVGLFHKWAEIAGTDYIVLRIRQEHSGGPPHDQIMEAIRRFGQEVLPRLN